jgi:hypothetical protein
VSIYAREYIIGGWSRGVRGVAMEAMTMKNLLMHRFPLGRLRDE